MEKEAKRAAKLEQKVNVVTAGLSSRQQRLAGEMETITKELAGTGIELRCFQALHEQEQRAGPDRMEVLQALVATQAKRETDLQQRYREATLARDLVKDGGINQVQAVGS